MDTSMLKGGEMTTVMVMDVTLISLVEPWKVDGRRTVA